MATGALRFRTPHIEELPTAQSRQAPGFAWVAFSGAQDDPAKNWGTTNRKRQRQSAVGPTEQQRETLNARQQREIERKIRDLNSDGPTAKDAQTEILLSKRGGGSGGGVVKAGKTTNTKKILSSGKTFAHYLDDEEAEIARTGRRDGDGEVSAAPTAPRASKTPIARRKVREESSVSEGSGPAAPPPASSRALRISLPQEAMNGDDDEGREDDDDAISRFPSRAELEALLNALPLTYNQARSRPPPPGAPPPRRFCETCGYWGRVRCMKCGALTCSVLCKDEHDQTKCLKMYA